MLHTGKINYAEFAGQVSVWVEGFKFLSAQRVWDIEPVPGLAGLSNEIQRQGLMIGYVNAFRLFAWTSFAAIPLVFFLRPAQKKLA